MNRYRGARRLGIFFEQEIILREGVALFPALGQLRINSLSSMAQGISTRFAPTSSARWSLKMIAVAARFDILLNAYSIASPNAYMPKTM